MRQRTYDDDPYAYTVSTRGSPHKIEVTTTTTTMADICGKPRRTTKNHRYQQCISYLVLKITGINNTIIV